MREDDEQRAARAFARSFTSDELAALTRDAIGLKNSAQATASASAWAAAASVFARAHAYREERESR